MVSITSEQLEALAQAGGAPIELRDPTTSKIYVLFDREVAGDVTSRPERHSAASNGPGRTGDPFLDDLVTFDGETPADLSARHDDYLYGDRS